MLKNKFSIIIALILVFSSVQVVSAQNGAQLPVYIVQPGENLTEIAQKFNITLQELISANNISDVNLISAGTKLLIPGLEGVSGVLTTETVNFGEQLQTILRRNNLSIENFEKLNHITSPAEIYVGSTLVLPQNEAETDPKSNVVLDSGDSQFTSAVENGLNPWTFSIENEINPSTALPGDVYYYPAGDQQKTVSTFSNLISRIEVNPLPVSQGHTSVVYIYAKEPGNFTGTYGVKSITFFRDEDKGFYYAFNGISAIADIGLVPLKISGQFDNGQQFSVEQNLLLTSGDYPEENLTVESTLIDQTCNGIRRSADTADPGAHISRKALV